jgi:preprotein translocase subunit YajC
MDIITKLFFMGSAILAQQGRPSGNTSDWTLQLFQFFPVLLLLVVMYVVLIRPQQIRAKKHAQLINSLKPRDKVVTSSGIIGEILTIKEHTVTIRSGDSKFEIVKSSISDLLERPGEPQAKEESYK